MEIEVPSPNVARIFARAESKRRIGRKHARLRMAGGAAFMLLILASIPFAKPAAANARYAFATAEQALSEAMHALTSKPVQAEHLPQWAVLPKRIAGFRLQSLEMSEGGSDYTGIYSSSDCTLHASLKHTRGPVANGTMLLKVGRGFAIFGGRRDVSFTISGEARCQPGNAEVFTRTLLKEMPS
jgi:hypothetical protein